MRGRAVSGAAGAGARGIRVCGAGPSAGQQRQARGGSGYAERRSCRRAARVDAAPIEDVCAPIEDVCQRKISNAERAVSPKWIQGLEPKMHTVTV